MGNSLPGPKTDKLTRRGNIAILETKKSTSSLSSFPIHKHRGRRHRDGGGQTGKGSPHLGKREDRKAIDNHHYCTNYDGSVLPRCIEYALSSCQGWRIYQEDAYFYQEHFTSHGTNHHGGSQCHTCCHPSLPRQDQKSKITMTIKLMNLQGHAIFGILDGHGGDYASKFVQEHFYSVFSTQSEYVAYCNLFLQLYPVDKDDDDVQDTRKKKSGKKKTTVCNKKICNMTEEEFCTNSMQLLKLALEKTFLQLDCLMLISMKEMQELTKDAEPGNGCKATRTENGYDLMDAGTAVLILIITPHFIVCANAGDCRAMLLRCCGNNKQSNHGGRDACEMGDFEVVPLSVDHKPYLQQEQERILKAGASVSGGKIDGILSLSRGLGDFNFKVQDNILGNTNIEHTCGDLRMDFTQSHPIRKDLGCSQHTVSPMPEITIEKRDCDKDLYLLGASDGIWDVVSNEECANVVSTIFREGESDMGLVAEEIIDTCLKKGSQDNMTVVVVKFPSQKIGQGGGVLKRRKRRLAKEMGTL